MDEQKNNRKITAIIPAYNEAQRIGKVLQILLACELLDEIIVVDDGSTDATETVVKKFPVRYIKIFPNGGKGQAMEKGVQAAKNDILFFCDADIVGLLPEMITDIAGPVQRGEVDMFIAMRNRKTFVLRFLLAFIPLLGGERVLTKELWQKVPSFYKTRFRIEAGLNFYAKYHGKGFRFKVFSGLTQTIKEKKYGFAKGFWARLKMMADYSRAQLRLEIADLPSAIKSRRFFVIKMLSSLSLSFMGLFLFLAVYFGPRQFLLAVFAKRIATDPSTPVVDFLLRLASAVSIDILLLFGAVMVLMHGIIVLINMRNLVRTVYNYTAKWHSSALAQIHHNKDELSAEKKEIIM